MFYQEILSKSHNNESSFSRTDTIASIQTALEDVKLGSIFKMSFPGKELKLVRNQYVKADYKVIYRGKQTLLIEYDSSYYHPSNDPKAARFFGVVNLFKSISKDQAKVVLVFHGIGIVADFLVDRVDEK
ncbi:hypothetical protein [Larkinella sp. GY13]|uniref:hypothetical protein n=1 Tax=Larkinella sp. GY13 TaxID=3453720 RepID=UPI003F714681